MVVVAEQVTVEQLLTQGIKTERDRNLGHTVCAEIILEPFRIKTHPAIFALAVHGLGQRIGQWFNSVGVSPDGVGARMGPQLRTVAGLRVANDDDARRIFDEASKAITEWTRDDLQFMRLQCYARARGLRHKGDWTKKADALLVRHRVQKIGDLPVQVREEIIGAYRRL